MQWLAAAAAHCPLADLHGTVSHTAVCWQICKASSEFEAATLSQRLTELQVEHCCLCNLMVTSNSRLIGPWNQDWNPPVHLSDNIRSIMVQLL